ncbi:hypothetical protein Adt_03944 [Abeliophyllum distichum]|uniref:Uncharacterized protein n=1 Tax=Abeliophyllum distichum TaxID=126358 RepID=A0ABD1W016_9LAMI
MADIMLHEARWLDSLCESASPSPSKRRGISLGIKLEKVWQANEKRPLSIAFDNIKHIMQSIRNNAKYFMRLVGNQVSYFDIQDVRSPNEYQTACATVDRLTIDCYRDYKLKAHNHLKEHEPSRLYGKLSAEKWQKCIDFFTSPTFVNGQQRTRPIGGKAKYLSVQGSKSFSATRYDSVQDKFVEVRETQQTQITFSGVLVDACAIAKEVLKERRRHAQLHRMERTIAHLTTNLQQRISGVVPEDDEDENENGGGLGDLSILCII